MNKFKGGSKPIEILKKVSIGNLVDDCVVTFNQNSKTKLTLDQIQSIKNKVLELLPSSYASDVNKIYVDEAMFGELNDRNSEIISIGDHFMNIIIGAFFIHLENERKFHEIKRVDIEYMTNETRARLMSVLNS